MRVKKRSGEFEELDISQVRKQTIPACEGLRDVSYEELELNTSIFMYDGITTSEIQKALITSANDLISVEASDYSYVAARLTLYDLYHKIKRLYNKVGTGDVYEKISIQDYIDYNKDKLSDWYTKYTKEEIEELNKEIDSKRDELFNYGAVKLMFDMYLLKNGLDIVELPQHMHLAIAMFIMQNEKKEIRLQLVKDLYSALSKLEYINPTPMNANGRTNKGGLISCLLTTIKDDSDSLLDKYKEIALGSKNGSGWGIDWSRIRSIGSTVGNNKGGHGGKIPFLKVTNDLLLAWNQQGKRPGAGAVYCAVWDIDIFDFIDIKKKHGDERRRAVDLFPAVILDDVFLSRMERGENYTLFSPQDCPLLTELYGDEFKIQYEKYEEEFKKDPSKFNKNTRTITTKEVALYIINSYYENGTPFLFFKDNANKQHRFPQNGIIRTANLCLAGETYVAIPVLDAKEGENKFKRVTIRELAKESQGKIKFPVYSASFENGEFKRNINNAVAFKTGDKPVIRLTLSNSDMIRCTRDHELYLKDGTTVRADDSVGKFLAEYSDDDNKDIMVLGIEDLNEVVDVYDLTVENDSNFYIITHRADDTYACPQGILVHNCVEVVMPTTDELTAVCNLGCINLAKINKTEDIERIVKLAIRSMDNSIDLTPYPSKESEQFQKNYRSVGLGVTGEAEYIATSQIYFGSEEHKKEVERIYSNMEKFAIRTSEELAKEKGSCIIEGRRNSYLMAIAPNSSSGIFASTTNSHEPAYAKIWMEGNAKQPYKLTAPNIHPENEEYYKSPYEVPIEDQIAVNAIRQKYIDMGISFNLYFKPEDISTKKVRDVILLAWKSGLKTTYYLRSKAIDNSDLKEIKKEEIIVEEVELKTSHNGISCVGCSN